MNWLRPLQEAWSSGIPWDSLPWFAMEKARAGACTTFLALEFSPSSEGGTEMNTSMWRRLIGAAPGASMNWKAEAVGDSCLFHVRDDRLLKSFPLEKPEQFSHNPVLVTTNPDHNRLVCERMQSKTGDCRAGDLFLLMTDALAKWFLQSCEKKEKPWRIFREFVDESKFKQFVIEQREAGRLENDDTTLMVIQSPAEGGKEQ
jgi:hypothetical protein